MKNAFYVLLGIALIILTSATTVSVMTVKPAKPKYFICKFFNNQSDAEEVNNFVKTQMKKGWVLKEIEGANDTKTFSTWIVIMEKY